MSAMPEVTYVDMTNALNRIFSGGFGGHASSPTHTTGMMDGIKAEPVFVGGTGVDSEGNDTMFARGYQRGRLRVRGGRRGRQPYRARGTSRPSTEQNSSTWRRQNPLGTDGQVTRCIICDSRFHWARSCPDAYENRQGDNDTGDHKEYKETACLSLFLGYTGTGGKEKESKIQRLVEEAKGCAVLDSGCSTTVCGADWYGSFIQNLSDVERDSIFVEESTSSFTFGDGVTVSSVMRVTLPCVINESGSDSRRDENDYGGAASVDDQTLPSRYTFEESEDGDVHGNATEIQVGEVSETTTEVESAPEIAPALPSRIVAGTRIQGTRSDTGELVSGRVMSRDGKASGRYSDCYNFRWDSDGGVSWADLKKGF
ncbi:hypothetical protein Pmani_002340 [Petrolisthes manimaculis]|uniref:Uncharacterized protein n=1 Tax=Petrolisthes manimaculis TaxID=1843537 RepID=A0AAE1UQJ9_9EUCA|nr:hypothetical protein Pmani_002340 [Petrolisthes manimaculis]